MNDMELLRELARQTPLPAPAELDAARARLAAAIAADPAAGRGAPGAGATLDQPAPSAASRPGRCGRLLPRRCGPRSSSCTRAPPAPPRT